MLAIHLVCRNVLFSQVLQDSKTPAKKVPQNGDSFKKEAPVETECRVHCHRATIFEVAGAIWKKFFPPAKQDH